MEECQVKQIKKVFNTQIDKLKLYYLFSDFSTINQLMDLTSDNDCLYLDSFQFRRTKKNVFIVNNQTSDSWEVYATLHINTVCDIQFQETTVKGVWVSYENKTLYDGRFEKLYALLRNSVHLQFNNITTIELAVDSTFSINKLAYTNLRNKELETILNGKVIDRNSKLDLYFHSITTANRVVEHYIQVENKDYKHNSKHKGMALKTYNKLDEIAANNYEKQYILDKYNFPDKLFRLEITVTGEAAMEYVNRYRVECEKLFFNSDQLQVMFFTHINRLLRWRKGRTIIKWEDLIATAGVR